MEELEKDYEVPLPEAPAINEENFPSLGGDGGGKAGDNNNIHKLKSVYITSNVLPPVDCEAIIKMAEHHASSHGGWQTERHQMYKTTDIDVRHVPLLLEHCNLKLKDCIMEKQIL